jgi:cell division protein FtsB
LNSFTDFKDLNSLVVVDGMTQWLSCNRTLNFDGKPSAAAMQLFIVVLLLYIHWCLLLYQEALTENERLRNTRIPVEIEKDLNGQIEKLTANIKGKERQIDDLNQEVRKLTSAKTDLEKTNGDLEVSHVITALICMP